MHETILLLMLSTTSLTSLMTIRLHPQMAFSYAATAILVALLAYLLFGDKRPYPVHSEGAILVTGASSGIGRHAALALSDLGFIVYATVRLVMIIYVLRCNNVLRGCT